MSDQQPSFRESLYSSLETTAEEPALRAILNAIPSVGGSLNELLAGQGQKIIEERKDNFLRLLAEHMEAIEADAIRKDYFQTPEGFDLLIKALDSSRRTRSEEKRDLIARILAGATSTDAEQGNYSPEEYLNLISDLTVQELMVARLLYAERPGTEDEPWKRWEERACAEIGINRADLHMALSRLGTTGLLQQVSGGTDDDGTWLAFPRYGESSYYRVTQAFDRLMDFVSLHLSDNQREQEGW